MKHGLGQWRLGWVLISTLLHFTVIAQTPAGCDLYPIALSAESIAGAVPGDVLTDIFNGGQPGNFGWLTWGGSPSEPTLVKSLTPPGNSSAYINPDNPCDHQINIGDWIQARPGVSNSKHVRNALDGLRTIDITVPIWNEVRGRGANAAYRVAAFARVRVITCVLPGRNEITARFLSLVACDRVNQSPSVNAGLDQTATISTPAILSGFVEDDNLPLGRSLTATWSVVSGPGPVLIHRPSTTNVQPVTTAQFSIPGLYVLRLTATDSELTAWDDVVVTVNRDNQPPQALPRTITLFEDGSVEIVLEGMDPEGDPLSFAVAVAPNYGTLEGTPPQVRYVPKPDYHGEDAFSFKVTDGLLESSNAIVRVLIEAINDPPVADPLSLTNYEDQSFLLTLSGSDVDSVDLGFAIVDFPEHGTLIPTSAAANQFYYRPATNFFGSDGFAFKVNDGTNDSLTAFARVTILPIDDVPFVNAGPDQVVLLPTNVVMLDGFVIYDVFPDSVQSVEWTKLSGAGNVLFGDATSEITTATFSQPGIYELRLTASDSFLNGSDDMVVTVNAPPMVDPGASQTNTLPGTVTLKGVALDDGVPSGLLAVAWAKVSGPGTVVFSHPTETNTEASFSQSGAYVLSLTADDGLSSTGTNVSVLVNAPPVVDAGSDQVTTNREVLLSGTVFDDGWPAGSFTAKWEQLDGPGLVTFHPSSSTNHQPVTLATFAETGTYVLRLIAEDGLASAIDDVVIHVNGRPQVSAGTNRTIFVGDSVGLEGQVIDDGLPPNAELRTYWTAVEGPGMVALDDPFAPNARASFSTPGTYVLRLTADDTLLMSHSDVTFVVRPINKTPAVFAGADQIALLGQPIQLTGVISDDGEPSSAVLATAWIRIGGPGSVMFAPEDSAIATAAFTLPGIYTLRLTATDSELSGSDDIVVIVHEPPTVDAGPDQSTTFGTATTLHGAASDDALPFNHLLLGWSQVSGPGTVLFSDPDAAVTDARFTLPGYYLLRLTATDSNAVSSDDVLVTVRPAGENLAPYVSAGTNQTVGLANVAELRGVVRDDGLPFGAPVSAEWSLVSGPGLVTFSPVATNNHERVVQAAFTRAGEYVLRLTANDTELTNFGDVVISIYPDNQRPVVNAGPDQTLASGPVTLAGRAFDDGRPLDTPLVFQWTVVSGPGSVTFGNVKSPITTVAFSEPGVYTLCLNTSDGEFSASDTVVITLTGNQAPMVDAGPDQILDLVVPFGAATSSTTLYPAAPNQWISTPSQPGLGGAYGTLGSIEIEQDGLSWSGQYLFAGGGFRIANGTQVNSIARWDGCGYAALYDPRPYDTNNPNSPIIGFISGPNGRSSSVNPIAARGSEVHVAGAFLSWDLDRNGGLDFTAKWNGSNWVAWGFVGPHAQTVTRSVMLSVSNDIYFGGTFRFKTSSAPAAPISFNLAKWDGVNWITLGEGIRPINGGTNQGDPNPALVKAIAVAADGKLYAGGSFAMETPFGYATNLARWDGTNWAPVSAVGPNAEIDSLVFSPAGHLHAVGAFTSIGGVSANRVARWDGTNWSNLGAGLNNIARAAVFDGNDLIVGGLFTTAGGVSVDRIARWNGTNWSGFPGGGLNGRANALAATPQGIFAGGTFSSAGGKTANLIALFGHEMQAALTGPDPITVSNAPSGGATVPVMLNLGHPCGHALTLTWNIDGGPAERTDSLPANTTSWPVSVTFTNLYPPGVHTLVATLTDGVHPPIIFSTTVTVLTPAIAALTGTVTDDGLPANSVVATWSLRSGPGSVFFSQVSTTNSPPGGTAAFTAAGTYTLQLTANDTEFVTEDSVNVNVRAIGSSNHPPLVSAGAHLFVALDEYARMNGVVFDDGLPTNQLEIYWSQTSGPGSVVFSDFSFSNQVAWATARFGEPGTYRLRLTAVDGEFNAHDDVIITVSSETNAPPTVDAGPDQAAGIVVPVALNGSVFDDGLPFGTITSDWEKLSGPGGVLFHVKDNMTYAVFGAVGEYVLRLNANDGRYASHDDVVITVLAGSQGPLARILWPPDSAIITAPVTVTGTVTSDILGSWTLQYRPKQPEPMYSTSDGWVILASGLGAIEESAISIFDPTLLLNGIYELQLNAVDLLGRSVSTEPLTVIVDRNLKVGHFTMSFTDLAVPLPGLPLKITRTYDSRAAAAGIVGDFGTGWTLDIRNVRLQKNRALGRNWVETVTGSPWDLSLAYHLSPGSARIVTVTFPDGRVEKFRFDPDPLDLPLLPIGYPKWRFTALGNTRGTLEPASFDERDGRFLAVSGSIPGTVSLYDLNFFTDWFSSSDPEAVLDRYPTLFRYTSAEGYRYIIDEVAGLQSVTDPNGNTLLIDSLGLTWTNHAPGSGSLSVAFQRDESGRITNIVDAAGHATSYHYDAAGDLVGFRNCDGDTNGFTYDADHRLLTLRDARGIQVLENGYDNSGRLVRAADAYGQAVTYAHDLDGRREFITNRLGFVTVHEYDEFGNVVRSIDPTGATTSFLYDARGNLLVKSNATDCACAVRYTYDQFDNRTSETDGMGNVTTYSYGPFRKLLTMREPSGFATSNSYDLRGNLISTRDSSGQVATFTYNAAGRVTSLADPLGCVTRFAYNALGFLTNEVNALGDVTEYTVDAQGNPLTQAITVEKIEGFASLHRLKTGWQVASGTPVFGISGPITNVFRLVMRYEYTPSGLPLRTLYYDGSSVRMSYSAGKLCGITDALGRETSCTLGSAGEILTRSYPDGCQERFGYDAEGRVTSKIDKRGYETRFEYDPRGSLIRTIFADGSSIGAEYNADGSLRAETSKSGEVTTYGLDASGNRTSIVDASGLTRFTYNYKRFATSKVDPLERTNHFDYDALGRNTAVTYADGSRKTAVFKGRLLASETDQNGDTTHYGYDALGRLIAVTNALGHVTRFQYDAQGNKVAEVDALERTTYFEYDTMRRLTRTIFPDGSKTSTGYDLAGRMIAQTNQLGDVTTYEYDNADRITGIIDPLGRITRYTYDCGGNRVSHTAPDGTTTRFEYDQLSRLIRTSSDCGVSEANTYDIAGRLIARTDQEGRVTRFGYDVQNRLLAITNALGHVTRIGYDPVGNRIGETNSQGEVTSYRYDRLNRRIETVYSDGTAEQYFYDSVGLLVTHKDQLGKISSFAFDGIGQLVAATNSAGGTTIYTYDAVGDCIAETDPRQQTTRFEYDVLHRRLRTILPDGTASQVSYDKAGLPVAATDALGGATIFAFDAAGQRAAVTDPLGHSTHYSYDPAGRLSSQTDAHNQTTTFGYDCLGRLNRVTLPDGTSRSAIHDRHGRLVASTDPNGNTTSFGYDDLGRLIASTNALGGVTQYGYDSLGRLLSQIDANGRATSFGYDSLGRRTRITYPDGGFEVARYDAKGRLVAQTDPSGNTTSFAYDALDRVIARTNALGEVTHYAYDELGRLTCLTDAKLQQTRFEYDPIGRLTRTTFDDGTVRENQYDELGRRVAEIDPDGAITQYHYDALGRLIAVTNALQFPTLYRYDALGRLIAQTDANEHTTTFAYDALGRRIRRTLPGGQSESAAYDPAGNVISRTDFNGRVTTYTYDALHRLLEKLPDPQFLAAGAMPVTFNYDAVGLRTNMTDASGLTKFAYNSRDQLVEKTLVPRLLDGTLGTQALALYYSRDASGNLTNVLSGSPSGVAVGYEYDPLHRLSAVADFHGGRTSYIYDPAGNCETRVYPNGVTARYRHDSLNRVTNLSIGGKSGPIAEFAYRFSAGGRRTAVLESVYDAAGNHNASEYGYTYDAAYRLTRESISGAAASGAIDYRYDPVGNRLARMVTGFSGSPSLESASYSYDPNDRLSSDSYDSNGNTTNAFVQDDLTGARHPAYDQFDFEDRLIARQLARDSQSAVIELVYDGDGHRSAKTVTIGTNRATTFYLVDDQNPTGHAQVFEELSMLDSQVILPTRVYAYGSDLISQDQLLVEGQGVPVWALSFYGRDGRGNTRFLTDAAGGSTDWWTYDAFGNVVASTNLNPRPTPNSYLFAGEQFDPDLQLYYLRARYADPSRGRFWTADTFEGFPTDPASLHRYTFNHNDPVNRIDPSGHMSLVESAFISGVGPMVRKAVMDLFDGVNHSAYGFAGGEELKFTSRTEAYMIDSLAAGPGWHFGKPSFWAAARGAPFLLQHNANMTTSPRPCSYQCVPFDMDVPVYGPGAKFPIFEFEPSRLPSLADYLSDATGGWFGEQLRDAARYWHSTSSDSTLLNGFSYLTGSLLDAAATLSSPRAIYEGALHLKHRADTVRQRHLEAGGSGLGGWIQFGVTIGGDVTGLNGVIEGISGVDLETGGTLTTSERWSRGLTGGAGLILAASGGPGFLNRPSTASTRIAARAEAKAATLRDVLSPDFRRGTMSPSTALTGPELCLERPALTRTSLPNPAKQALARADLQLADELRYVDGPDGQREFGFLKRENSFSHAEQLEFGFPDSSPSASANVFQVNPIYVQMEFPFARGAAIQTPRVTTAGETFVRVGAQPRNLKFGSTSLSGAQPGTYAFPEATFNAIGQTPEALKNFGDLPGTAPQYFRVLQPPPGTPIQRGIVPGGEFGGVGGVPEVIFPKGF